MRILTAFSLLLLLCACKPHGQPYNGYIEADLTYLSSDYPGRLTHLWAHRGDSVRKNQPLFSLEKTSEQMNLHLSQLTEKSLLAQREQILSQLIYARTNHLRTLKMAQQKAASQRDLDLTKRDLDVLENQLAAIDFQIHGDQVDVQHRTWQKSRKENAATENGLIFDTYFTQGEYVQAGQPVLSLITQQAIKVIFFVPEKALSHVYLTQKIQIERDGESLPLTGAVNYISNTAQYTSPLIFSRENRQELVFRVEAHILNADLCKVHLGQPVSLVLMP